MKRLLFIAALLLAPLAQAQHTPPFFAAEGEDLAWRFTAFSLREEIAADDPRLAQTQDWLTRAAKATGEDERAIAAASVRAARYFLDLTRVRASPLETLEALAISGKPGQPMGDVLMHYVEARRAAADKSHGAALQALGAGR